MRGARTADSRTPSAESARAHRRRWAVDRYVDDSSTFRTDEILCEARQVISGRTQYRPTRVASQCRQMPSLLCAPACRASTSESDRLYGLAWEHYFWASTGTTRP